MQNLRTRCAVLGLAVLTSTSAYADGPLAGTYDVKFEQVSTNCERSLTYPTRGSLKIDVKGSDLQVDIERTPIMVGKPAKSGKLSARSPKPGRTPIEGMDGVFSVAGRVTVEGMLSLVMVGEYQAAGKPLCTQSWNISGLRGGAAPAADKPADKPADRPADKPKR
jgi:hypothetical protein